MYIIPSVMGFTKRQPTTSSTNISTPKRRLIIFSLVFLISFVLLCINAIFPHPQLIDVIHLKTTTQSSPYIPSSNKVEIPRWLEIIRGAHWTSQKNLRVGLVNFDDTEQSRLRLGGTAQFVTIDIESVSSNVTWKKLFPEWIDEKPSDKCPIIPLPEPGKYTGLDVVVTKLPCEEEKNNNGSPGKEGIRDVHRLQVSLATARLIVENGIGKDDDVYAVFVGKCEPMVEMFRCDDMVWHGGLYWVYKPKLEKLREMISMPTGACELARPYDGAIAGSRQLQGIQMSLRPEFQTTRAPLTNKRREAFVTMLHSTEYYVCGAIALAQSILQTNTTKDLVLLADRTISDRSIAGLQAAGWKIRRFKRIKSPNAKADAYNLWNYSKLRVWQLTEYDKVMFIDSDFIVLRNIDHFFNYPQLSAGPNDKWLFNSGIMLLEPSECFFKYLMRKRYTLKSYNGGDQGYLNEVLTWWHRFTRKLNYMKFYGEDGGQERLVPNDRYTIHYLGWKPWICYRDYDCNWDRADYHRFASDDVHARWWQVYDAMPKKLQRYCGMTKQQDAMLRKRRVRARNANLYDGHWKIQLKDPRQFNLVNFI